MSSKLLKPGSEMYGKRKESPDQGLLHYGRQVTSIGTQERKPGSGADKIAGRGTGGSTRDKTGSGPEARKGYGAV